MLNAKKGSFTKLVGSGLYDWNSRFRSWYNKDRGEERGRKFYKIIAKLYICNGESSLSQGIRTSYLLPKMTWHLQGHSWILSPWSFSWPYSVWLNVVLYAYLIVNIYIYIYIYISMNTPLMSSAPGKVYIAYIRYISSYKQYDTERYFEVQNNNFILL